MLLIYLVGMAFFDYHMFLSNPSTDQLEKCKKDDLIAIANHFHLGMHDISAAESDDKCYF